MFSLFRRDRKKVAVYLFAGVISLPVGFFVISWAMNTYSFLSFYRPEHIFREEGDPAAIPETRGTEILQSLNADIEQESQVNHRRESWLLARVDRLWHSVRRYVSPSSAKKSSSSGETRARLERTKPLSRPFPEQSEPAERLRIERTAEVVRKVLSLAEEQEADETAPRKGPTASGHSRKIYRPLLNVSAETAEGLGLDGRDAAPEWLYRFEPLKGMRTQSLIYRFNGNLAIEGTVEATPEAQTDPDLTDFGFRTVHALNSLRDRPGPSLMTGYNGVYSGYPLSYGIGLSYQVSPLVNLRFDYSFETPNDFLVEYNGTWESSLMANYNKTRAGNPLSIHSFFLGFRYLVRQQATRIPLHTGFFYSTNMEDEPLASNVSMGFSVGGGINRRDLRLGFAWRFRIWDNPEQQFLDEQEVRELQTKVSNQFLFTLMF